MVFTNHPVDLALRYPAHTIALGRTVATPAAVARLGGLEAATPVFHRLIERHATGDWGGLSDDDRARNDRALQSGHGRLLSAYSVDHNGQDVTLLVITEADRSVTTVLLPEDY